MAAKPALGTGFQINETVVGSKKCFPLPKIKGQLGEPA